jgi:hypothetical protein
LLALADPEVEGHSADQKSFGVSEAEALILKVAGRLSVSDRNCAKIVESYWDTSLTVWSERTTVPILPVSEPREA